MHCFCTTSASARERRVAPRFRCGSVLQLCLSPETAKSAVAARSLWRFKRCTAGVLWASRRCPMSSLLQTTQKRRAMRASVTTALVLASALHSRLTRSILPITPYALTNAIAVTCAKRDASNSRHSGRVCRITEHTANIAAVAWTHLCPAARSNDCAASLNPCNIATTNKTQQR